MTVVPCRSYKGRVVSATGTHVRMELQVTLNISLHPLA